MPSPSLSAYFQGRQPSAIRLASIRYAERPDHVRAINVAIGNVVRPMYPALQERLRSLSTQDSPFADGIVCYSSSVGVDECRQAFAHIIESSGFSTEGLHIQITDGASQGMELVALATCGDSGTCDRPILLIDPAYSNYRACAFRTGRRTVSICRTLQKDGRFTLPTLDEIDALIEAERPGALLVIPYDNPTGQFYDQATLNALGRLCVQHNIWLISDEAYRELSYIDHPVSSIWGITESEVPGITGRRIELETASKVWNACGLRLGALVTDNLDLHRKAVAENTFSLCSNTLAQYIFGALAHEPIDRMHAWYADQRRYYSDLMSAFVEEMHRQAPQVIVSQPDTSLYSVLDVRDMVDDRFNADEFAVWCAEKGQVQLEGEPCTLIIAPMGDFYGPPTNELAHAHTPGRTQMRVAHVRPKEEMVRVPELFSKLLHAYLCENDR